jgi:hypothetical protein
MEISKYELILFFINVKEMAIACTSQERDKHQWKSGLFLRSSVEYKLRKGKFKISGPVNNKLNF